jgi:glucan phosphoethanolaminetransferase (alkaline phosphatase superfamily)
MIQRPQTLFLALVAVAMALVLTNSIWAKTDVATDQTVLLTATAMTLSKGSLVTSTLSSIYIAIAAALGLVLSLVSISQFKNRLRQLFIGIFISFVVALVMGLSWYYIYQVGVPMFANNNKGVYGIGFYAAVAGLLFNMIANKLIKKDEDLVRSSDRMR